MAVFLLLLLLLLSNCFKVLSTQLSPLSLFSYYHQRVNTFYYLLLFYSLSLTPHYKTVSFFPAVSRDSISLSDPVILVCFCHFWRVSTVHYIWPKKGWYLGQCLKVFGVSGQKTKILFVYLSQLNVGHKESTGISFHRGQVLYRVWYQSQLHFHPEEYLTSLMYGGHPCPYMFPPVQINPGTTISCKGKTEICSWSDQRDLLGPAGRRPSAAGYNDQTLCWLDILHALRWVRWCTVSFSPRDPITKLSCVG